ncbi:hypothetical protein GGD41_002736 [Paraburkholderia bryophila]|uniref:Uncharacterized protein n=1 Tax=Paraburkholderia bryophila TaxID=420952 RepID=A0A7Y9W837_9BURK|nr:hypothetical protein [Paraburkholderia bryophila]
MAIHRTAETARLVLRVRDRAERRQRPFVGQRGIAWKHKDQAFHFAARISAHAIGQTILAEIRHVDALARAVVGPAVVTAANRFALHHALMQRHLPMRTTVFKRERLAALRTSQHDRLARERHTVRLAALHFMRPGERIPVVRVNTDAAQIAHRRVSRGLVRRMRVSGRMSVFRRCVMNRRRIEGCFDGVLFERGNSMHRWGLRARADRR